MKFIILTYIIEWIQKGVRIMNKVLLSILFIALVTSTASAQFAGGSGTEENPYQIETLEQLQAIADSIHLDKHFIQTTDITHLTSL